MVKTGDARSKALDKRMELLETRLVDNRVLGQQESGSQSSFSSSFNPPPQDMHHSHSSNLRAVELAVDRHLNKVNGKQEEDQNSGLGSESVAASNTCSSSQTIVTSHRSNSNSIPMVVAESPPTAAPAPGDSESPRPSKTRKLNMTHQDTGKRKSVPVKRALPTLTDAPPTETIQAVAASVTPKKSSVRKNSVDDSDGSTFEKTALQTPLLDQHSSSSRDRSNPGSRKKGGTTPLKHKSIARYFPAAKKPYVPKTTPPRTRARAFKAKTLLEKKPPIVTRAQSTNDINPSKETEKLRQQCLQLEKELNDKTEQLKAVGNNQTILHTALKTALTQKDKEMEEMKQDFKRRMALSSRTIEKLIRAANAQEGRELRQKLASDGARLGRIVSTRAGMRTVENWEDGFAPKALKERKAELELKKQNLERRRKAVQEMGKNTGEKEESQVDNTLELMEANESLRMHWANMKKQEEALMAEERALYDEKSSHIRALRKVGSEDASRFTANAKLHDRYILLSLLGKGGFSEVWRAYDLHELREVAVKIHQLDTRWSEAKKENYTKHVSREYEIHRDVRHPRIVSLFDVFEIDLNCFATVLEYCKGTDLDTMLNEKKRLPERDARSILLQILSGMRYLSVPSEDGSRQAIIHYDLKPGNILFDEYGDAKITDFGLSKIVDAQDPGDSMELTSQGAGTYWYLPPECFVAHESVRISNKVDVWAIGVIYYQMLYGKRPFGDGQSQDKLLRNHTMLNAKEVSFPSNPPVSEGGMKFIQTCLTYDQTFRPTIAQLCKNPYLEAKEL